MANRRQTITRILHFWLWYIWISFFFFHASSSSNSREFLLIPILWKILSIGEREIYFTKINVFKIYPMEEKVMLYTQVRIWEENIVVSFERFKKIIIHPYSNRFFERTYIWTLLKSRGYYASDYDTSGFLSSSMLFLHLIRGNFF